MKLHLQRNSDGVPVTIEDDLIIMAYTANSLTTIEYQEEEDGYRKIVQVADTLANVGGTSQKLVSVTTIDNAELIVDSGDASGTTAFKLVDSGQNFATTVSVGMRVKNTDNGTFATVEAVDSNTQLSLNVDIMTSGDNFVIYSNAGSTAWINKDRIGSMYEVDELGIVMMDNGGQGLTKVSLQTNLTILKTAMAAKEGDTTFAIGSYTASPNTIVLATAEGDVEASFIAGDKVTVYGEGTTNDLTYDVVSAAFAAGKTTITVTETPTAATAYGGRLRKDVDSSGAATVYDPGVANTGVTAVHSSGDGKNFITTLTISSLTLPAVTAAAAEAHGYLLYTFPAGSHWLEVGNFNFSLQGGGTIDADTPDVGIGTVIATGAVSLLSTTATFEDILTGQTASDVNGTNIPLFKTIDSLSSSSGTKTLHLNYADTWAGADTVTGSGTLTIKWSIM